MWTTSTRDSEKKDENIGCERFGIEIAMLWRRYCPEWRFMQFISNFQSWMGHDCFYIDDYDILNKMEEYCKTLKGGF